MTNPGVASACAMRFRGAPEYGIDSFVPEADHPAGYGAADVPLVAGETVEVVRDGTAFELDSSHP